MLMPSDAAGAKAIFRQSPATPEGRTFGPPFLIWAPEIDELGLQRPLRSTGSFESSGSRWDSKKGDTT